MYWFASDVCNERTRGVCSEDIGMCWWVPSSRDEGASDGPSEGFRVYWWDRLACLDEPLTFVFIGGLLAVAKEAAPRYPDGLVASAAEGFVGLYSLLAVGDEATPRMEEA